MNRLTARGGSLSRRFDTSFSSGIRGSIRAQLTFATGCYTFGLAANAVLKRASDELLQQAVQQFEQTGRPQRRFDVFRYRAGTWPTHRTVIVKAECNAAGTNRRFLVSNRPGAADWPEACYDEYAARGQSESRNKEIKCGVAADRPSCHPSVAN